MAGVAEVELGGIIEAAAGPAVTTVRVRHAELLFPNGSLWHHYPKQPEELHYTVRADGSSSTETFAPMFSYMGFRYVSKSPKRTSCQAPDAYSLQSTVYHLLHLITYYYYY
jgi:hypothetical protein